MSSDSWRKISKNWPCFDIAHFTSELAMPIPSEFDEYFVDNLFDQ